METVPTVTDATEDGGTTTYAKHVPWIVTVRGIGAKTWDGMRYSQHIVVANSYNAATNRALEAAMVTLPPLYRNTLEVVACDMLDISYELPGSDGHYYIVSIECRMHPDRGDAPGTTRYLTLDLAKSLTRGTILARKNDVGSDGKPRRYKVTSVKTWKRTPEHVVIKVQHGTHGFGEILEYQIGDWYILANNYLGVKR